MAKLSTTSIVLLIIAGLVVAGVVWIWSGYNSLVRANEAVDNTWAQVETQYQRRFDLIPNLQSIVAGAADFEKSTFTAVTEARTQWQGAGNVTEKVAAANSFDSALSRLLVTVENYPDLKATANFADFQAQLEGTENRVAVARKDFNDEVRRYNVTIKVFPKNILAGMFGYEPTVFFGSTEGADEAPSVEF